MLGIFGAYLAWRLMWRLLRTVLFIAAVVAVVLMASSGHVSIGRLGESGFWRSQAAVVKRDVERTVEHAFRPSSASALRHR